MAEEHSEHSTTESGLSLPHITGLAHSLHIDHVQHAQARFGIAVEVVVDESNIDHVPNRTKFTMDPQAPLPSLPDSNGFDDTQTNIKVYESPPLPPAQTLGYYKSRSERTHPAKQAAYLSQQQDHNTTCCGVNVIEIGQQISKYEAELLTSPWKICCCFPGSFCYYLCAKRAL
eukprot:915179_1